MPLWRLNTSLGSSRAGLRILPSRLLRGGPAEVDWLGALRARAPPSPGHGQEGP